MALNAKNRIFVRMIPIATDSLVMIIAAKILQALKQAGLNQIVTAAKLLLSQELLGHW